MASQVGLMSPTTSAPKVAPKASSAVRRTDSLRSWFERNIEKGKNKVFAERVNVTPDLARIFLERNKDNRKLRPNKLSQIKADMSNGRFKLNGEPIIFAKTGDLNDGQHRLQAIIETNMPQDMLVTFGVERESRLTVDTGAARSASDHLSITGWPYASIIASIARTSIGFERTKGKSIGRLSDISSAEVFNRASGDKLLQECGAYVGTNQSKLRVIGKPGIVGLCYYEFSKRKPLEAKTFFEKLRTGSDLSETSPIRILREYLIARPKLPQTARAELIIKAWNAFITDKQIKQLRFSNELPAIES